MQLKRLRLFLSINLGFSKSRSRELSFSFHCAAGRFRVGSVSLGGTFVFGFVRGFRLYLHPRLSYVAHLRRAAEKVSAKHQTSSIKRAPSAYCFEEAVSNIEFRMLTVGSIRRSKHCDAPCLCVSVREIVPQERQGCKRVLD